MPSDLLKVESYDKHAAFGVTGNVTSVNESLYDLLLRAAAMQRENRRVLACLVVGARGSTPQSIGALMLVDDAAQTFGTIGGGCVEAELRRRAFELLSSDRTGIHEFKFDHDYGWDDGLICGGVLRIAIGTLPEAEELDAIIQSIQHRTETSLPVHVDDESGPIRFALRLPPRPRVYIAGAGHLGQAVARHGVRLEFDVSLFDDRADLLDRYAPDGCAAIAGEIGPALQDVVIDQDTYCVVVTRGHRHDASALEAVIDRDARYVGMIGSKRKILLIREELIARGVPKDALDAVAAPIGLDIGAVTVEEIALAIAGQLVQARRRYDSPIVEGPFPLTERATPS